MRTCINRILLTFMFALIGCLVGRAQTLVNQGSVFTYHAIPDPSIPISSYNWSVVGGTIIGSNSIDSVKVQWTGADGSTGTVSVFPIGLTGCNGSLVQKSFTIKTNLIPADPGSITGPATVSQNASYNFSIAACANASKYFWTLPNGATIIKGDTTTNVSIYFSDTAKNGNISVKSISAIGISSAISSSLAITVVPLPNNPGSILTPVTSVCQGQNNVVFSISPVTGAYKYKWTLPVGASINGVDTSNSINVHFGLSATSGQVTVKSLNTLNYSRTTGSSINVIVNPLPDATIKGSTDVHSKLITNDSVATSGYSHYAWSVFNSKIITSDTIQNIQVLWGNVGNDSLKLVVTNSFGCKDSSVLKTTADSLKITNVAIGTINNTRPFTSGYKLGIPKDTLLVGNEAWFNVKVDLNNALNDSDYISIAYSVNDTISKNIQNIYVFNKGKKDGTIILNNKKYLNNTGKDILVPFTIYPNKIKINGNLPDNNSSLQQSISDHFTIYPVPTINGVDFK